MLDLVVRDVGQVMDDAAFGKELAGGRTISLLLRTDELIIHRLLVNDTPRGL